MKRSAPSPDMPHYQRIKEHIVTLIAEGKLKPGDRVYSESELVASFSVSRMTANRALRELMFEGILTRSAGLGTFVSSQRRDVDLLQIRNIADEISERGRRHTSRVLVADRILADARVAQALELPTNAEVMHTLIVHLEDGEPIQVEERYVNPAVAPDYLSNDFNATTPNEYLTRVAPITEFEHFVEAIKADAVTRKLLDVSSDQPCLRVFRRTWSGELVCTCALLTYPGNKYRLEAGSRRSRKAASAFLGDSKS
ncbi:MULTISPECIES: histidine utilization repressor [unclassified Rhizobium]|jgi:GntR family histidine utilization transcriptional repressor|uniref:histidine utilization repressor n=1 Tax=unclassified Rhizobium TaxID=2613769 RepID=UPI00068D0D07|nr:MULTISPECIES: histidine utilization repressor [unclassified Rhizobium]MBN8952946.1 histidine utilization repressor [Rhizobium tropici]OJY76540.1 MAG: histidine utilization repressor [Rhizobium sp. 60-20]RKD52671.1 GntR family histidine utilization transcriptional repressor [Rhizobium sp. WW_1]